MSIKKRRTPHESRQAALAAARDLLTEAGPQAVTLKAVARRIGQTHANVLHHFGSAAALQAALGAQISDDVCAMILQGMQNRIAGKGSVRDSIDLVFDAFDEKGGAALFAWMAMTGDDVGQQPMLETIRKVTDAVSTTGTASEKRREIAIQVNMMAFADALIGPGLSAALSLRRDVVRERAATLIESILAAEMAQLQAGELN